MMTEPKRRGRFGTLGGEESRKIAEYEVKRREEEEGNYEWDEVTAAGCQII